MHVLLILLILLPLHIDAYTAPDRAPRDTWAPHRRGMVWEYDPWDPNTMHEELLKKMNIDPDPDTVSIGEMLGSFLNIDTDGDKDVSRDEYVAHLAVSYSTARLASALFTFYVKNYGSAERKDDLTVADIKNIYYQGIDKNGDGTVSVPEFKEFYHKMIMAHAHLFPRRWKHD